MQWIEARSRVSTDSIQKKNMYLHSPTNNILTSFRIFSAVEPQPCGSGCNSHVCWSCRWRDRSVRLVSAASLAYIDGVLLLRDRVEQAAILITAVRYKPLGLLQMSPISRPCDPRGLQYRFSQRLAAGVLLWFCTPRRRACCSPVTAAGGAGAPWNHAPSTEHNARTLRVTINYVSYTCHYNYHIILYYYIIL